MDRKQILLVDDEPLVLQALGADLGDYGYEVTACESGYDAVDALEAQAFDLVISDLVMEGIDGIEVLRQAKELRPHTRAMILTGYGDLTSAVDALRIGADDYILKPCDRNEMRWRVDRCMGRPLPADVADELGHLTPVCCVCKKVRVRDADAPEGIKWLPFEQYLLDHVGERATSTYCPKCAHDAVKGV
jgi:DNA-binding response OmpR family regulator